MEGPWHLKDLEVIGYGTVLKETMLPSVVPPIFRLRTDAGVFIFIFPPYHFSNGLVWNATKGTVHDLNKLAGEEKITVIPQPIPAQAQFEMWVDESNTVHYEPRMKAEKTLRAIALNCLDEARHAFAAEDYPEAERLCGIALSADDRLSDSLVLKAAIYQKRGDATSVRVMQKLAARHLTPQAFEYLLDDFLLSSGNDDCNQALATQQTDLLQLRPMFGIAALR